MCGGAFFGPVRGDLMRMAAVWAIVLWIFIAAAIELSRGVA